MITILTEAAAEFSRPAIQIYVLDEDHCVRVIESDTSAELVEWFNNDYDGPNEDSEVVKYSVNRESQPRPNTLGELFKALACNQKMQIKFEVPVYYDTLSLLTTGGRDEGEIKQEVQGQLEQGDPMSDSIVDDLEDIAEEKGLDPEAVRDWFCDMSMEKLMQYVEIDMDGIDVDYSESEALDDRRMVAFCVPCTFDAERYLKEVA